MTQRTNLAKLPSFSHLSRDSAHSQNQAGLRCVNICKRLISMTFQPISVRSTRFLRRPSTILAVQEVAHRGSPSLIQSFALVGVRTRFRCGLGVFGFAARWAAVGKSRFIGLQLELFRANGADSDRKSHPPTSSPSEWPARLSSRARQSQPQYRAQA
jgi:hypothetical protein